MNDKCRSCGADIVWVRSRADSKRVPLDARMLTIAVEVAKGIVEFHRGRQSHFATCPNADKHRKPRQRRQTPCAMCEKPGEPGAPGSAKIGSAFLCSATCLLGFRARRSVERRARQ